MGGLLDKFVEWVKEFFADTIIMLLTNIFKLMNKEVAQIAGDVGKNPKDWNSTIFEMIKTLSETVIIPIAGMIITFVLCYELITLITEKNNMHDIDTFMFFKYIFKMCIAVYLVTHTFDITMAIFDVTSHIISSSSGVIIGSNTDIDFIKNFANLKIDLMQKGLGEILMLWVTVTAVFYIVQGLSIVISMVLYGRMIEIYLYCSIAPIPFATMSNKEWGSIGTNYIKSMCALGLQGFFIIICVAIYSSLLQTVVIGGDVSASLFKLTVCTVVLAFSLFKTGAYAKAILNAH